MNEQDIGKIQIEVLQRTAVVQVLQEVLNAMGGIARREAALLDLARIRVAEAMKGREESDGTKTGGVKTGGVKSGAPKSNVVKIREPDEGQLELSLDGSKSP